MSDGVSDEVNDPPKQRPWWARWGLFAVRWGIAVIGIAWVVSNLTIRDHVLYLPDDGLPIRAAVVEPAIAPEEPTGEYVVVGPDGDEVRVDASQFINPPDRDTVEIDGVEVELLGMRLVGDINRDPEVTSLLVRDGEAARWVEPAGFDLAVPQPKVQVGLRHLLSQADLSLLALGLLIFPVTFVLTAWRWQRLLAATGLRLPYRRAFTLTMVGQFYSSFLPGSTGGDVVKAVYAAKQSSDRSLANGAVVSVFVDRVIGLIALVLLGGVTSAAAWAYAGDGTPTAATCRPVLGGCALILVGSLVAMLALASGRVRRLVPFREARSKLPGSKTASRTFDTLAMYARRPGLVLWGVAVTLPVHLAVSATGMLGGMAFGLPVNPLYYYVVVPVVVLVGSIPISPQGAGVMEFFAVTLLNRQGVTIGEAFALTLFIRLAHVLWYLTGGIFVLRGGYGEAIDAGPEPTADDTADDDAGSAPAAVGSPA